MIRQFAYMDPMENIERTIITLLLLKKANKLPDIPKDLILLICVKYLLPTFTNQNRPDYRKWMPDFPL